MTFSLLLCTPRLNDNEATTSCHGKANTLRNDFCLIVFMALNNPLPLKYGLSLLTYSEQNMAGAMGY